MIVNKIICSDAIEELSKFNDESVDAIITDPPYGVTGDDDDYIASYFFDQAYRVLKPSSAIMILVGQKTLREFWNEAEKAGFKWLNTIAWWHRNSLSRQTRKFSIQYDPILYLAKGDFKHRVDQVRVPYRSAERLKYACNNKKAKNWTPNPLGAMCPDVWEIPAITTTSPNGQDRPVGHKWQKPVKLMERMILACTSTGDIVLDPYCGSGSTCLAAKNLERKYIGIEINQNYFEIACKRLQKTFTTECQEDINCSCDKIPDMYCKIHGITK